MSYEQPKHIASEYFANHPPLCVLTTKSIERSIAFDEARRKERNKKFLKYFIPIVIILGAISYLLFR